LGWFAIWSSTFFSADNLSRYISQVTDFLSKKVTDSVAGPKKVQGLVCGLVKNLIGNLVLSGFLASLISWNLDSMRQNW